MFRQSDNCDTMDQNQTQPFSDDDNLSVRLCGKYMLNVTIEVLNKMKTNHVIHITWMTDNKQRKRLSKMFCLDKDLVRVLVTQHYHPLVKLLVTQEQLSHRMIKPRLFSTLIHVF